MKKLLIMMFMWLWLLSIGFAEYESYSVESNDSYNSEYIESSQNNESTPSQWEFFYWMMSDVQDRIQEMNDYNWEHKEFIIDILQEVEKTLNSKLDIQVDDEETSLSLDSSEEEEGSTDKVCPASIEQVEEDDIECLIKLIE